MTIQTMRRRVLTGAAAIAVTLAAACGGTSAPPAPRDVVLGVDVCEYCHMSVDEPDFAAQWVAADGRKLVFDEPGCLLAWLDDHAGAKGTAFVADAEGTGWLPATEASFVHGGVSTAMGFDIRAFRSRDAAEKVAAETGGAVRDWATLISKGVGNAHTH